jgi:hypothetical protein
MSEADHQESVHERAELDDKSVEAPLVALLGTSDGLGQ